MTTLTTLLSTLRAEEAELSAEITRLERVSPDSAHREFYRWQALSRALKAVEEGKVFLGGDGAKVLIVGLHALPDALLERFIAAVGQTKSRGNEALVLLDGQRGEIRRNNERKLWVVDLSSTRGQILFGWHGQRPCYIRGPRVPTTNGGGHWCGVVHRGAMPHILGTSAVHTVEFLDRAEAVLASTGMTPMQVEEAKSARYRACRQAAEAAAAALGTAGYDYPTAVGLRLVGGADNFGSPIPPDLADRIVAAIREEQAAAEAAKRAAEEARIMAELEAEQARLAAERAAAEAEARRAAEVEATCTALGIAADQWTAMTDKQRRLALHRARLAGLVR